MNLTTKNKIKNAWMVRDKCITCGRFFKFEPGTSWAQNWSYDASGDPVLHEPVWQCKRCTEKHGPLETNCAYPERYSGCFKEENLK